MPICSSRHKLIWKPLAFGKVCKCCQEERVHFAGGIEWCCTEGSKSVGSSRVPWEEAGFWSFLSEPPPRNWTGCVMLKPPVNPHTNQVLFSTFDRHENDLQRGRGRAQIHLAEVAPAGFEPLSVWLTDIKAKACPLSLQHLLQSWASQPGASQKQHTCSGLQKQG